MGGINASFIVESTITAILLFWVITHASAFSGVVEAIGKTLVGSARALWGG